MMFNLLKVAGLALLLGTGAKPGLQPGDVTVRVYNLYGPEMWQYECLELPDIDYKSGNEWLILETEHTVTQIPYNENLYMEIIRQK